ncbi:MAG: hypothetical protein OXC79_13770 [Candidatus Poribacteria bacterium]|nr:hypothetical protein [Candidatus Poribacteria bacterium]
MKWINTDQVYEILKQIQLGKTLDEVFENIHAGLQKSDGKPQLAAQRLGISRTTLWRKLKAV